MDNPEANIDDFPKATINVDPEANTITFTGNIPGITKDSLVYFETGENKPDGEEEKSVGQLIDRVVFK